MSLKIIAKSDIAAFVSSAMSHYEVLSPIARENAFAFAPIRDATLVRLDYNTTILPPKKAFLPQEETLFTFEKDGGFSTQAIFDTQPRLLFGVHTCDIHAMKLLDAAFLKGYADAHYRQRRENTLIVGIECLTPCDEYSFCKSMETLSATEGYDLHLTDIGEVYTVDVATRAGEWLLAQHANARDATRSEVARLNRALSEKWRLFKYKLDVDVRQLPALMAMSYKSPVWEELGNRCLACGACNYVCPTCYCFNVVDVVGSDGMTGGRKRVWDSCQLDAFALVATGENFRKTRAERQRHRFFRKTKYLTEMHNALGCVGCGRCGRACLVNITMVDTLNALYRASVA